MITVIIQNDLKIPKTPTLEQFQTWVNAIFQSIDDRIPENVNEVCIRIVDKNESAELNKRFRKKQEPTNILSFPNESDEHIDNHSLGDIAICAELVESESNEQGIPITHHWAHLTIHGVLHLLGYDHIEEKEAIEMENLEIRILKTLKIKNPYQEPFDDED